jgi:hypothetical protein
VCSIIDASVDPLPFRTLYPQKLTFLRMGDMMIDNWSAFGAFLQRLTCPP